MFLNNVYEFLIGQRSQPRPRRQSSVKLRLEGLETREVPTAITASLSAAGQLTITGTDKADTIKVHQMNNKIFVDGVTSKEWAAASVKKIVVNGGAGNDIIDLRGNTRSNSQPLRIPAVVNGGAGNDTIWGTQADDTLDGGADADVIYGNDGHDTIYAEVGLDRVVGGRGNDTIHALLNFNNLLNAKSGRLFYNDSFASGDGTDTLHVRMDLQSFASRLLTPSVREISKAVSLFDPVVSMLNTKIPAVSQFDGNLTYGSVLRQFKPELGRFLDKVAAVNKLNSASALTGTITLGQFKVSSPNSFSTVHANPMGQFQSAVINNARKAGLSFALLDDPVSAVRMMMGNNVQLVHLRLELPKINASLNRTYSVPTGIPGINASVDFGGSVWTSAGATFGVDTSGIWAGNALKGLFISHASAMVGGNIYVKGGVAVGIPNLITIGSVKGYGEVNGTIQFALKGGSKVYFDQLPKYNDSLRALGQIHYDLGIEVAYKKLVGTDHHTAKGKPWNIVYTTYEWVSETSRRSFGSGTFRV